ncbi:MYND-type domain-containing protein [Mycena sanguinolenta]|uniref:MYND-type domain-containing protein n=1 Tax=Mycena sanguinolenta TaxID=230812 RepID=A0A8H7DGL1_9AGAR|nr:MYND-type domain-containing protein [Mycena sanguinolenta]
MHRSLRLDTLSLLPISIRRFAIPAANGSVDDLDHLLDLVEDDEARYTQCLPVLYANLDPHRIPDEENLDTDAVRCANFALDSLANLDRAPKSTWPDLWPRVWAWIVFFEAYHECLLEPFARPDVCLDLVGFVHAFNDDETTKADINQTIGWRTLVMKAWSTILESVEPPAHHAFPNLCRILREMKIGVQGGFEEILDGAEGATNLGYLVVESIGLFVGEGQSDISDDDLVFLTSVLLFLHHLGNEEILSPALMENGGATDITLAAGAGYDRVGDPDYAIIQETLLLLCMSALHPMLSCHEAMCDALAAGLLNSILLGATISPDGPSASEMRALKQILTLTLPASTAFRDVLSELDTRLQDVRNILESPRFRGSWMYDDWLRFTAIADDRIAFMKVVQSSDFVSSKACDNMDCGVMGPKTQFKRCSHCQQVYYCSSDCQRIDWRVSGHRELCQSIRIFSLKNKDLGMRNLQFMRELLHRDLTEHRYSKNLLLLPPNRLQYFRDLAQTSQCDPFATIMDYGVRESPQLHLEGISRLQGLRPSLPIHWEEHIGRMRRSHGRMELHLMMIPDGFGFSMNPARMVIFPQRSDRPTFHERVRQILQAAGNDVQEEIRHALAMDDGVVKIH